MTLAELQLLNSQLTIKNIDEHSFEKYGCLIDMDVKELIERINIEYQIRNYENLYIPSIEKLEEEQYIQKIINKVYGHLDAMAGIVMGYNDELNGIEYHQCSETIIALTDFILVVGNRWHIRNGFYNTNLCEIFYVSKGMIIECYSTTLHYTPISVEKTGFKTICLLLRGTGDVLNYKPEGILKRKNKWFIAHKDNYEKVKAGDFVGLLGEVIKIKK